MKPAGSIAQQYIRTPCFGRRHRVIDHRRRVRAFLPADQICLRAVRPLLKLLSCRRAEGIGRCKHHLLILRTKLPCQLPYRSSLPDAVDSDHHNDRRPVLEFISRLADIHLLLNALDQKLPALCRLLNMLLLHLRPQVVQNITGRLNSQVAHDQHLFQFLIKVFVNMGKTVENTVHSRYDIISRLSKSLDQTFKKTYFLLLLFCHLNLLLP